MEIANGAMEGASQLKDGSVSPSSSQWGVTDSPQGGKGEVTSLKETSKDREMAAMPETATGLDDIVPDNDSPALSVVKAKFERNYKCEFCPFKTVKSREYLYHVRDEHYEKLNIFECHLCDYASRYNNKLSRHMSVHKKYDIWDNSKDIDALRESPGGKDHELRVKPLKLKRLHVKAPSIFQVSHESNLKKEVQEIPPDGKDVFKMVLAADGSHHYQCRDCLFYASSTSNVKKHHVLCHNKVLYCGQCTYYTMSQAEYYEHIVTHVDNAKTYMRCEDCSYATNSRTNFDNHRNFHGSGLPSKCRVCNFAADSESKVKRHMATQHTNKCASTMDFLEVDGTNGAVEMNESWGEAIHSEAMCEDGAKVNLSVSGNSKPQQGEMDGRGDRDKQDDKKQTIKCPHCLVVCLRRANLTRHLVARHNYNPADASVSSMHLERQAMRKRKLPFYTSPGSAAPATKYKRSSSSSSTAGQDVLKCSECSYYAKWPSDLRRHKQVHTMVKRFKCSICTNKYKYVGDLNVHMRRDHLMEPQQAVAEDVECSDVVKKCSPAVFRCPICAYSTATKADLEQHSKQHGDIEKTFQCRLCDYQTYWRGDVGRHLFRHHNIHLSKDGAELENHFIFRPDIRPLTKMPLGHILSAVAAESMNVEDSLDESTMSGLDRLSLMGSLAGVKKGSPNPSGKEGLFACSHPNCEYRASTADRLDSHMAYHENLKQFMCPTCGKRTNWKWDVVKHMVKVHHDTNATADDVIALSLDEARETIADYMSCFEKKPVDMMYFACSLCDFKSMEQSLVIQHLNETHADEDGNVLSFSTLDHDGNDDFNPQLEEDKFVEPPPEELAKHDKPFACSLCNKPELTQADVKKHYSYTHPYKEVRITYTVDGTEFNYDTLEIYNKRSNQRLDPGNSGSAQKSPHSPKFVRPDSKYSNPKMHGYIKPFKCSVCGLRSNWKWDVKKHLRAKHVGDGGFVIMLSLQEAQMTYGKECSRSHPKCESQSPLPLDTSSTSPMADVKYSPDHTIPSSPSSSFPESVYLKSKRPLTLGTMYDPGRRQWKCSGCDYITNWRRNMARHMGRHHPLDKNRLRVIALHLLSKEEQESLFEERKGRLELLEKDDQEVFERDLVDGGDGDGSFLDSLIRQAKPSGSYTEDRLWRCPRCSFQSTLKTHIIVHMQKHEMRPFLCAICNTPFMNRGPLHRHLQRIHERKDYVKLVKVNIHYEDTPDQVGGEQQMVEEEGDGGGFQCSLCEDTFSDKPSAIAHLKDIHEVDAMDSFVLAASNHQTDSGGDMMHSFTISGAGCGRVRKRKLYHCRLCPYQSQKKTMLNFHMTYHKPTPTNRLKCKYCPYYVNTTRLLHQHQRKWHLDTGGIDTHMAIAMWENKMLAQASPPHQLWGAGEDYPDVAAVGGTPRKYSCGKCPYTTNSKNDFFYHKQFHRPKRTAEFKCEFCDYWVVHKRLLKQHMKLHTEQPLLEVSPAKSLYSDPGLVYDPVELTEVAALKQRMISAKILPSLSKSPKVSPMKLASSCLLGDAKPGYVLKNGLYRKLHKCPKCPYTNTRARNMQLHVMMHGPRDSSYPLMRCPYCDYYVGSKGLLSHHMKVHQKHYGDTPEKDALVASMGGGGGLQDEEEDDEDDSDEGDIQAHQKVDTLLQISRMKKFGCEKCPYASAKRQHFERHLELHGSRQRYTCQYCDYSVPSSYLLTQHSRLHLMPNQNLLWSQSVNNLQHLTEVPADVALASALPPSDSDMSVTISVIHDHLGLYENSIYDPEQKKLYRCDRCPYANVRRDYLLSHLKFHMVASSYVCPYCDYSAPKQPLLTQHIRVHFCPLPELSDWLLENGQTERETSHRNIDLAEALKVAREYQNQSKKKAKSKEDTDTKDTEGKENIEEGGGVDGVSADTLVCQYCDREFVASEKLVKHELQHLIGNQFEMALKVLKEDRAAKGKTVSAKGARDRKKDPIVEMTENPKPDETTVKDTLESKELTEKTVESNEQTEKTTESKEQSEKTVESKEKVEKEESKDQAEKEESKDQTEKEESKDQTEKEDSKDQAEKEESKDPVEKEESKEQAEKEEHKDQAENKESKQQAEKTLESKDQVEKIMESKEKAEKEDSKKQTEKEENKELAEKDKSKEQEKSKEHAEKIVERKEWAEKEESKEQAEKTVESEEQAEKEEGKEQAEKTAENEEQAENIEQTEKEKSEEQTEKEESKEQTEKTLKSKVEKEESKEQSEKTVENKEQAKKEESEEHDEKEEGEEHAEKTVVSKVEKESKDQTEKTLENEVEKEESKEEAEKTVDKEDLDGEKPSVEVKTRLQDEGKVKEGKEQDVVEESLDDLMDCGPSQDEELALSGGATNDDSRDAMDVDELLKDEGNDKDTPVEKNDELDMDDESESTVCG